MKTVTKIQHAQIFEKKLCRLRNTVGVILVFPSSRVQLKQPKSDAFLLHIRAKRDAHRPSDYRCGLSSCAELSPLLGFCWEDEFWYRLVLAIEGSFACKKVCPKVCICLIPLCGLTVMFYDGRVKCEDEVHGIHQFSIFLFLRHMCRSATSLTRQYY